MNEDYASYELAKRLKECGFDEPCDHIYLRDRNTDKWEFADWKVDDKDYNKRTRPQLAISAPLLYHAQKWLREAKGIDVLVWNCACGYGWEISKSDAQSRGTTLMDYDDNGEDKDSGMWLTYENALSAGIETALELLNAEP